MTRRAYTDLRARVFGPLGANALRSSAMRTLSLCFGWFSLLAALAGLTACGSGHDDLTKRLASMQGDLTRLQNHSDRLEERLEALEMRKDAAAARPAAQAAPVLDHPKLMVVKLEPGDDSRDAPTDAPGAELRPEDSASDKSPRPVIRVHGPNSDGDVKMASDSDSPDSSPRRKRGQ